MFEICSSSSFLYKLLQALCQDKQSHKPALTFAFLYKIQQRQAIKYILWKPLSLETYSIYGGEKFNKAHCLTL